MPSASPLKMRLVLAILAILARAHGGGGGGGGGTTASCGAADARLGAISYRLARQDARSGGPVTTRRRLPSLAKCQDFAESRRALAFNFDRATLISSLEANCILLKCPETNGLRDLINATGVDYFSAYPDSIDVGNGSLSCVEKVGLFGFFDEPKNFTNARATCEKFGAALADVTSERRTRDLALRIGQFLVYVGLSSESKRQRVWKNEYGEPLSCFDYRAWDAGEPSHSRGCVGLSQEDRASDPVWRVVVCSAALPFVCELPRWRRTKIAPNSTRDQERRANNETSTSC